MGRLSKPLLEMDVVNPYYKHPVSPDNRHRAARFPVRHKLSVEAVDLGPRRNIQRVAALYIYNP